MIFWSPYSLVLDCSQPNLAHTHSSTKQVKPIQGPAHEIQAIYISTLGVLAPFRKLGIGRMLLALILDLGCHCIVLHVPTTATEAQKFYVKHGFTNVKMLEGYYKRPRSDAFLFVRSAINAWYLRLEVPLIDWAHLWQDRQQDPMQRSNESTHFYEWNDDLPSPFDFSCVCLFCYVYVYFMRRSPS